MASVYSLLCFSRHKTATGLTITSLRMALAEKTTHHRNALLAWQEADNEVKRLKVELSECVVKISELAIELAQERRNVYGK